MRMRSAAVKSSDEWAKACHSLRPTQNLHSIVIVNHFVPIDILVIFSVISSEVGLARGCTSCQSIFMAFQQILLDVRSMLTGTISKLQLGLGQLWELPTMDVITVSSVLR